MDRWHACWKDWNRGGTWDAWFEIHYQLKSNKLIILISSGEDSSRISQVANYKIMPL
jgi:hypothetical protein